MAVWPAQDHEALTSAAAQIAHNPQISGLDPPEKSRAQKPPDHGARPTRTKQTGRGLCGEARDLRQGEKFTRKLDRNFRTHIRENPNRAQDQIGCFQIESSTPARCSACSIFGSLKVPITTASQHQCNANNRVWHLHRSRFLHAIRMQRRGDSWCSSSMAIGAVARISSPPSFGAMVVPNELNAWVKSRRLDAVSGLPKTTT